KKKRSGALQAVSAARPARALPDPPGLSLPHDEDRYEDDQGDNPYPGDEHPDIEVWLHDERDGELGRAEGDLLVNRDVLVTVACGGDDMHLVRDKLRPEASQTVGHPGNLTIDDDDCIGN